jgi:Ca2+-binding EF-hand superfamily protein
MGGRISKAGLDAFLAKKGVDSEHRQTIIDELFDKCTKENGEVDLNEFCEHYLSTKKQLRDRDA